MVVAIDNTVVGPEASPMPPAESSSVPPAISTSESGKGGLVFCADFRKQATPPEELDELCFTNLTAKSLPTEETIAVSGSGGSVAEVSCASSTCSIGAGNGNLSDSGSCHGTKSDQIHAKLLKRTTSRHGRASQRWAADPLSHSMTRLTTGCIPILSGGNVMFVSASSKPSWIFPKGGWENDEKMEESALRECFEEAGVIGILGPKLSEVQYETRKARKRRLETEEMLKRKREKPNTEDVSTTRAGEKIEKEGGTARASPVPVSGTTSTSAEVVIDTTAIKESPTVAAAAPNPSIPNPSPVPDEALARIRGATLKKAKRHPDETASIQSDASTYSHVRMCLFPLYVTCVKREWPEGGRLRRAVPIDEAIQILEARPELQAALKEVKEKGLHLLEGGGKPPPVAPTQASR